MIIRRTTPQEWLAAGSSPVDWCEENYAVSSNVAEFTNTVSNFMFFLLPIACLVSGAWRSYTRHVSVGLYVQLGLLVVVGLSSAYFHATLSLLGQMLDEVAILWHLCISYSFVTPNKYRPRFFMGACSHVVSVGLAVILTGAWFVYPQLNAYVLFAVAMPILSMMVIEVVVYRHPTTLSLAKLCLAITIVGYTVWIIDKTMCGAVRSLGLPGLHNAWHILIAIASYLYITLFSFWRCFDFPESRPSIRYWHRLPYVHCDSRAGS